ncbi:TPA: sporulation protein YjcZ [bacterium]|nr:sporulation protein YjcZ [bacterium]
MTNVGCGCPTVGGVGHTNYFFVILILFILLAIIGCYCFF